jgi:hypothetical protein
MGRRLLHCGTSNPLCAQLKGYHPEGAADRLLHCRLLHCGAPSADGFMAEMGHKPAYLRPRRAGGMSAMPAIVSNFAAMQRRKCSARALNRLRDGLLHRAWPASVTHPFDRP